MEDIHFLEGKELKYSRAYYELTVPDIVKRSVYVILGILSIIFIYIIVAPYDVIIKSEAQIRPSEDLVYITPITSGIVKEKLFKNGQKVFSGQTLYVLDNIYIERDLETQYKRLNEYQEFVNKDKKILEFLKNYEEKKLNFDELYLSSLENQIKKLRFEMESNKYEFEVATKLYPQSISKMELQEAENKYKKAKIEYENFFSDNQVKYSDELKYNKNVVSEIDSNIEKLKLQMNQTVLKSTCDGYVEELQIINAGESIIAELHAGDEFTLSLPKYPSSNSSSIKGQVLIISKDSILGADGKPYFLITGTLDNVEFIDKRNKNTISLIPGMTATARIKVRTEPLYLYLLKQIY